MATAFWRTDKRTGREVLVAKWRDETASGGWKYQRRPNDRTKRQAEDYARDMERKSERLVKGLETDDPQRVTFGELLDWWWERYGQRQRDDHPDPGDRRRLRGCARHAPRGEGGGARAVAQEPQPPSWWRVPHLPVCPGPEGTPLGWRESRRVGEAPEGPEAPVRDAPEGGGPTGPRRAPRAEARQPLARRGRGLPLYGSATR